MIDPEKVLRIVAAASASTVFLLLVLVYRRLRPSCAGVPYTHQAAAALGLSLGILTVLAGVGHSVAVASLALSGSEQYGPLTILRFTTGAMLIYAGAMGVALYRPIRASRRWAMGVSAATTFLFCLFLLFLFFLTGTGETVPPMLGLWSVYLGIVGAAVVSGPHDGFTRAIMDRHA